VKHSLLGLALALAVLAAGCGTAQPQAAPTAAPPTAAAATPGPAAASGPIRVTLAPDGNEARYRAQEQLTGRPLGEAVGRTAAVTGSISLSPQGAILPDQSKVMVDLRGLKSNEDRRDNWIQRNTLQTAQFPNAELVPREAPGLPTPLPTSGEATFKLVGDLTVHGVTRPTTWDVTTRFAESQVEGSASTRVKMTDFNMEPPRVGPVLSLEDELTLELDFRATTGPAPGAAAAAPALAGSQAPANPPAMASRAAGGADAAKPQAAPPVAECRPTPADQLGPFYVPNAPLRDTVGSDYVLSGVVRAAGSCAPIPGARIEFWLANPRGVYDDAHRATILAGPSGEYRFESNVPVPYSGRPPHIHVRVSAPSLQTLVTQHYPEAGRSEATFDLVLQPA
jgi:polyisoprenoid-binding protein YceI